MRRDKSLVYQEQHVVDNYDGRRFGGKGGSYVNDRELEPFLRFIRERLENGRVLDMPVGTGRLARRLVAMGKPVEGADLSPQMIAKVRTELDIRLHECDAMDTGLPDGRYDAVASVRFLQHIADIRPFLKEMGRLVGADGYVLFDVFGWSPRSFLKAGRSRVFSHSIREVQRSLEQAGFQLIERKSYFLLPPLVLRHLPLWLNRLLGVLEVAVPSGLKTRHFFAASPRNSAHPDSSPLNP